MANAAKLWSAYWRARSWQITVGPVFCRFVLPCQIVIPPIKTKMLPVKFIVYTYHNPKPTPYSNADALN